jgi:hypothetical protein
MSMLALPVRAAAPARRASAAKPMGAKRAAAFGAAAPLRAEARGAARGACTRGAWRGPFGALRCLRERTQRELSSGMRSLRRRRRSPLRLSGSRARRGSGTAAWRAVRAPQCVHVAPLTPFPWAHPLHAQLARRWWFAPPSSTSCWRRAPPRCVRAAPAAGATGSPCAAAAACVATTKRAKPPSRRHRGRPRTHRLPRLLRTPERTALRPGRRSGIRWTTSR